MSKDNDSVVKPTIEEVQKQFETWRASKQGREPIPEELWQAAVSMAAEYPISHIAEILSLSHSKLRSRLVLKAKPHGSVSHHGFVEVDFPKMPANGEYIVELENANGSKMKVCIKGTELDVFGLAQAFWAKKS